MSHRSIHKREIINSYEFDPFGNEIKISEPLQNPYRYALKHYDEETTLIYFGKRYYHPKTKRWITPDPLGPIDLVNLYAFVRNNPFRYTDYTGLFSSSICSPSLEYISQLIRPPEYSSLYEVGEKDLEYGKIMFINGIFNRLDVATQHAKMLSNYGNDVKITGLHNASHQLLDPIECQLAIWGFPTTPSMILLKEMKNFHNTKPRDEKMLIISTSGGAIHVRNALQRAPEEIRNRIESLSIAPAAIITDQICFRASSYASEKDLVVWNAVVNDPQLANAITWIRSDDTFINPYHSIGCAIFEKPLRGNIKDYLSQHQGPK